jgi:hypothetical protein
MHTSRLAMHQTSPTPFGRPAGPGPAHAPARPSRRTTPERSLAAQRASRAAGGRGGLPASRAAPAPRGAGGRCTGAGRGSGPSRAVARSEKTMSTSPAAPPPQPDHRRAGASAAAAHRAPPVAVPARSSSRERGRPSVRWQIAGQGGAGGCGPRRQSRMPSQCGARYRTPAPRSTAVPPSCTPRRCGRAGQRARGGSVVGGMRSCGGAAAGAQQRVPARAVTRHGDADGMDRNHTGGQSIAAARVWRVMERDGPRAMAERSTTQGTVKQSRRVTEVIVVYWYAFTIRKFASTSAWHKTRLSTRAGSARGYK